MDFKAFWFESNQVWGKVKTLDDWKQIVKDHNHVCGKIFAGKELMKDAKATMTTADVESGKIKAPEGYLPSFGLCLEHDAPLSLDSWAKKNNIYDVLANV